MAASRHPQAPTTYPIARRDPTGARSPSPRVPKVALRAALSSFKIIADLRRRVRKACGSAFARQYARQHPLAAKLDEPPQLEQGSDSGLSYFAGAGVQALLDRYDGNWRRKDLIEVMCTRGANSGQGETQI